MPDRVPWPRIAALVFRPFFRRKFTPFERGARRVLVLFTVARNTRRREPSSKKKPSTAGRFTADAEKLPPITTNSRMTEANRPSLARLAPATGI
eukprot:8398415-Pyramimonas_sp.AAC.1